MRVAGYVRVSTREQGASGLSLEHQRQRIGEECQRRGWRLADLVVEVQSTRRRRPARDRILEQLDAGDYDVLMFTRMDRFCRSLGDFAVAMDAARRHRWALVMLEPAVDMTEPFGAAMGGMAAVFAELERALISMRTREGLAVARARGTFRPGEALRYADRTVIDRIMRWHHAGVSQSEIARRLNLEGTAAPGGGFYWQQRTVGRLIHREEGNTRVGA